MKLPRFTFRILLPLIYFLLASLPIIGMILTIAEGPNPFGFWFFLWEPGLRLLDAFERILPEPDISLWLIMPIIILVNAGIVFLLGYLIDYSIQRRRRASGDGAP